MSDLLNGLQVIENASVITGPLTGMILADLGADVVKVENPNGGDQFRRWDAGEAKVNLSFANYNRGKRSITVNLRSEEGLDVYRRLARDADVVIENFRPGFVDHLGIGYETLSQSNPRLVYCEITGVGATGPYRDRPTYDAVAQAISGLWSTFVDMDQPEVIGPAMADQLTGIYGVCAVLSGLASRQRTGIGIKVSVNMLSCAMSFVGSSFASHIESQRRNIERTLKKTDRGHASQSYAFIDSDGKPFTVHLSTPTKFWEGLCATVGYPELANDDRYNSKGKRMQRYDELQATLAPIFATRNRYSWIKELAAADVPCAPILTPGEALDDPQVQHLNMLWQDPESGYSLVRSPIQHEGQFAASELAAPWLGEHTAEVLSMLGYKESEIDALRNSGAI